ncbi:hypothetical protein, partial [Enterococcus faecium]|uniref:hypothetical protein n=1 Tax=Enterococcus faecium TaxID=1352 RepID=UPI0034E93D35
TLIQKRIHASTYRYFQEVKGWSDREVNLWMDQTFRDLYQAIDSFLDQHVDQKAYQNLSVLREFKIRAYNASAHDFRVLQLIDSHPALMFYYAN